MMRDGPFTTEDGDLLATLRAALRRAGWTQSRLAAELGVGSATIKRWLHGRGLQLGMLLRLCALAGTTLAELAAQSDRAERPADTLTLAQEEALTESPGLSTIFFLIINGWPLSEAEEGFQIPPQAIADHVARLERLALVDRLPSGRLRARLDPAHVWNRRPMRRHFDRHLKPLFFEADYGDPSTLFGAEMVKLSPTGIARVAEQIERFRAELRGIADDDRRHSPLPARWYAVLATACATEAGVKR